MKKLLILLAGLIVVIGLGVAAVVFLLGGNEEAPEIEAEISTESESEPAPDHGAPVEGHQSAPAVPVYVTIEIISVPVLQGDHLTHYLYVESKVEVADKAAGGLVREKMPFLRDAVIRRLHREPLRRAGGNVDIAPLRETIRAAADVLVGPGQVVDVLIAKILKGK